MDINDLSEKIGAICAHLILVLGLTLAGANSYADAPACSEQWNIALEKQLATSDGQGHGPDIGSDEWKSVIEKKLGINTSPELPKRNTQAWCQFIDQRARSKNSVSAKTAPAKPAGPAFSCTKIPPGSIEATICAEPVLAQLDRTLMRVYTQAIKKAQNAHPSTLKAEQRGWIKGRNDCWKETPQFNCIKTAYEQRISELQAKYRLVPFTGPVRFICNGNPANEVAVNFFQTEPKTLIAEYGDSVSLMYVQPNDSGTQYQGRNESFWQHQGEALISWGFNSDQMRCTRAQ